MTALTLVKVGGWHARTADRLARAAAHVEALAAAGPIAVVTGGGAFADAVRDAQRELACTDDAAHWMAIHAMDQVAHVFHESVRRSRLADGPEAVAVALAEERIPILLVSRWLRQADPLPRTWDVTSDSIAAWAAGQLGATALVLLKARLGDPAELTDAAFGRFVPPGLPVRIEAPGD